MSPLNLAILLVTGLTIAALALLLWPASEPSQAAEDSTTPDDPPDLSDAAPPEGARDDPPQRAAPPRPEPPADDPVEEPRARYPAAP